MPNEEDGEEVVPADGTGHQRDSRRNLMADEEPDDSRHSDGQGSSSTATGRSNDG